MSMIDYTTFTEVISRCHTILDEIFLIHQEAILSGRFKDATGIFNSYRQLHDFHKSFEDENLIPKFNELGNHGRWPASMYMVEHDKIRDLLEKTEKYLLELCETRLEGRNLRRNIIAFLDREKTLKGYCEHHQDREENGLLPELDRMADSKWRADIIGSFIEDWEKSVKQHMDSINKLGITGNLSG